MRMDGVRGGMVYDEGKNTLLQNVLWSFLGKIVAMICLVLLDITAARMLSVADYAEWVYFFSIQTMLFYIGWMGINTSAKVYVSKCVTMQEREQCIRAAFVLRFFSGAWISSLFFMILPEAAEYLGYPAKYPALKSLLAVSGALVFFNSFTELYKELCIGLKNYIRLFMITAFEYGGYFLFSAAGLVIFRRMQTIAAGYLISGCCVMAAGWHIFGIRVTALWRNAGDLKAYIRLMVKYALPIAFISLGSLILVEMDTFMLGLLCEKEEAAVYNIAKNLCAKATHVNYALTTGTMTSLSALTAANIRKKRQEFQKINRINMVVISGISAVMFLAGTMAVSALYGMEYRKAGVVMRFLIPYYVLYSISNFYGTFLDFREKAKFRSICFISVVVMNVTLNYLLIPVYGAKGAAVATDLSLVPYTIAVVVCAFVEFRKMEE